MKAEDIAKLNDNEITQEIVDETVTNAKKTWRMMVEQSGVGEIDFLLYDKKPTTAYFLHFYKNAQQAARELGLNFPDLIEKH